MGKLEKKEVYEEPEISEEVGLIKGLKCTKSWNAAGGD